MNVRRLFVLIAMTASFVRADEPAPPQEMLALKRQYEQAVKTVTESQQGRTVNLQKEYFVALTSLQQDFMKDGDMDGVLTVKKELERFTYKQEITADQEQDMPPQLYKLRINYDASLARIETESGQQTQALTQQYIGNLQALEKKLAQNGNTAGAKMVNSEMEAAAAASVDFAKIATSGQIVIRAYIDGSDVIRVQGNNVWYEHGSGDLPGRSRGHNEPTFVNEDKWIPWWDGHTSRPYENIAPALRPAAGKRVAVTKKFGRGEVTLVEQPTQANNYMLKIRVDDSAQVGADWYELQIRW